MTQVKKLILDVLKPHQPNALDFASALADQGNEIKVTLTVVEVDEKTESVIVEIEGDHIHYDELTERIKELGGSIHSIDVVQVTGSSRTNE